MDDISEFVPGGVWFMDGEKLFWMDRNPDGKRVLRLVAEVNCNYHVWEDGRYGINMIVMAWSGEMAKMILRMDKVHRDGGNVEELLTEVLSLGRRFRRQLQLMARDCGLMPDPEEDD